VIYKVSRLQTIASTHWFDVEKQLSPKARIFYAVVGSFTVEKQGLNQLHIIHKNIRTYIFKDVPKNIGTFGNTQEST
jgi:hypothetical protein